MVHNFCPFPGAGQNRPFLLLHPWPIWRRCISSSCGEACNQKASCVCWGCCWSWTSCQNLCRQTHGFVPSNCALVRHLQRLESLVTDIRGVNPPSLVCFVPNTDPIQQQHNFPHNPPLTYSGPGASRWAPLFMCFLKMILVWKAI